MPWERLEVADVFRARARLASCPGRTPEPRPALDAVDETDQPPSLAQPCPCCGGPMIVIETFQPGQAPSRHPPRAPPAGKAAGPPPSPLRTAGCPALADSQTDPIKMLQTTHQDLACRNRGRSEERRGGKRGVSTCKTRGAACH